MNKSHLNAIHRALGVIVGLYGLFAGWGFVTLMMMRHGVAPPIMPDPETMGSFVPVLMTLPEWRMPLWGIAVVLYLIASYRMLRGRPGALLYCIALALDLTFLVLLKLSGAVHHDPEAIDLDYVTAGITITLGVIIVLVERAMRQPGEPEAAARA